MGVIKWNGIPSSKIGYLKIRVSTAPNYEAAERNYEVTHVPGRNGDIIVDTGSYSNVERVYNISFGEYEQDVFKKYAPAVLSWLNSANGYARLEDTYEPNFYRMAMFKGPQSLTNLLGQAGGGDIVFNCKPQRFYKAGEVPVTYNSTNTETKSITYADPTSQSGTTTENFSMAVSSKAPTNPSVFTAIPKIVAKATAGAGTGKIIVRTSTGSDYVISLLSNWAATSTSNGALTIDSPIMDCYGTDNQNGLHNLNSYVYLFNGFPELAAGVNSIGYNGNITSVEVIPNWWTI